MGTLRIGAKARDALEGTSPGVYPKRGCGTEHIARAIAPSGWPEVQIAMLTAYFDASGTEHDQPAIVVAGFLSSAKDWAVFEELWTERLGRDGITYFHSTEFAHSTSQFKGWRDRTADRKALMGDLLDIITANTYRKFGCTVQIKTWKGQVSAENREQFELNAYCLAGVASVCRLDTWAVRQRIARPIEVIFEDGDAGRGKLQNYLSKNRIPEPMFRPKKDRVLSDGRTERGVVPLQAADLLTYEMFLGFRNWLTDTDRVRHPLPILDRLPGTIGYFEIEHLEMLGHMLKVIDETMPADDSI